MATSHDYKVEYGLGRSARFGDKKEAFDFAKRTSYRFGDAEIVYKTQPIGLFVRGKITEEYKDQDHSRPTPELVLPINSESDYMWMCWKERHSSQHHTVKVHIANTSAAMWRMITQLPDLEMVETWDDETRMLQRWVPAT